MQRHRVETSETHSHLSEPFRIHELADADERRLVSLRLPKDGCATVGIWDKHVCVAPLRSPSKVTFDVSCPSTQSLQTTHCRFFFIHSCPGSLTKNIKCKARTVRIQQFADSPPPKDHNLDVLYGILFFFFFLPQAFSLSWSKQHARDYSHNYRTNYRALQSTAMLRMITVNHNG